MGRFVFGERASRYEMLGVAALVAGIVLVLHSH
jgi:multidrug transporter EmrE-like cation transporter